MNQNNQPLNPIAELGVKLEAEIDQLKTKEDELEAKLENLQLEQIKIQSVEEEVKAEKANIQAQHVILEDRLQEVRNEL